MYVARVSLHEHLSDLDWELKKINVNEVLATAQRRLGENGVLGIVDFDGDNRERKYEIVREQLRKKGTEIFDLGDNSIYLPEQELFLTRLQESETDRGHILTLGLDAGAYVTNSRDMPLEDALKQSRMFGEGAIIDHPFGHQGAGEYLRQCPDLFATGNIVGYEVHNRLARLPPITSWNPNRLAQEFYTWMQHSGRPFPVGALIGGDGHSVPSVAVDYTILGFAGTVESVLEKKDLATPLIDAIRRNKKANGHASTSMKDAYIHAFRIIVGKRFVK